MAELQHRRVPVAAPARRTARRPSRMRLMTTVAVAALAALAFFTVFWVIGAVIGLAVVAALGAALLVGGVWLWLKIGWRGRTGERTTPAPLP